MQTLRILVADELSPEGMDLLDEAGEVVSAKGMDEDTLRDTLPGFHALIVRSATKVTARSLEKANALTVIGRAGIGIDNIDVEAATERGIVVMNTPEAGAVTTAELAVALIMNLARNIAAADASMKQGKWEKSGLIGTELKGQVLGVLGLGRIGSVVAERGLGLRMRVLAHDPQVDQGRAPVGVRLVTFDELLERADFLTVHVPLLPATRDLLDKDAIARMKPTARIIHAARGGIVNEEALCDALDEGRLAGAALDVFSREPLPPDSRLRFTKNLVLTPHLGASTREAKRNVSVEMARQVVTCLRRGIALNGVNVPRITRSEARHVAPFLDLAHNLSSFLVQVFDGELESLRLTLQGELPASVQHPVQVSMLTGALASRSERPVTPVNAERMADRMGLRVHTEISTLKRDFVNVIRIEAVVGGERHSISGTVLGYRHGRMVEFDDIMLDAIPEGPMLVTFHRDEPGVVGRIGSLLGAEGVNVARLQLGAGPANGQALGIWNLSRSLDDDVLARVRDDVSIVRARTVN